MKPMLKASGTKRLKLKYDKLLSIFGFNYNLRRYSVVSLHLPLTPGTYHLIDDAAVVGRCRSTPVFAHDTE